MQTRARPATCEDLASLRTLLSSNECLKTLGAQHGRQDWVSIGEAYVNDVLQSEMQSWETCAARYSSAASELWVLLEEPEARVVGCIGAVATVDPGAECTMELVRMYVDQGNDAHAGLPWLRMAPWLRMLCMP